MGQHGDEVDELDQPGRAQVAHEPLGHRRLLHEVKGLVEAGPVLLGVGDGDLLPAPDADGLELLAAPHGARAAAAVDAVAVVGDVGVEDEVLSRRADAQNPGRVPRPRDGGQLVVRLGDGLAPEPVGRQKLGFPRRDVEHDRARRGALDDQGVVTGRLEGRPPSAAGVRGPQDARQRRLEDHVAAAGGRGIGADEGRGGHDEGVVGAERVAGRVDGVVEEARGQAPAAEVVEGVFGVEGHGPDLSAREVGDEDAAVVAGDGEIAHGQRLR